MRPTKIGGAYVSVYSDNSPLRRGLKSAGRQVRNFGGTMQSVGSGVEGFGGGILRTLGGFALPLGMAIRSGMQFQDVMSEVGAVTQASEEQLAALTRQAKELGRTTSFTHVEVGSGQAELGRAGFSPDEIQAAIPHVLNLARATKTELPIAAGIAAASLRQFGMEATETGRISDALVATANKSFTTLETIGESLKFAGPVASDFNMSIEETLALVGALGNVGIQGSLAGTSIRRLLTLTGADAEKLSKIFGVAFTSPGGDARKLIESLADVNEATKDLGTGERAAKFKEAFGLLGITGASSLSKNVADVGELFEAIDNSEGLGSRIAKAMDDNLGGSFRMMLSAIAGVSLALTEALSPSLRSAMGFIQETAGTVTKFIENNKEFVAKLFAGAAGVAALAAGFVTGGVALAAFGFLVSGIGTALGVLATVFGFLVNPIGLVVAGIAALTATTAASEVEVASLFQTLKNKLVAVGSFFSKVGSGIASAFKAGDWSLAGQIAIAALKVALVKGFQAIRDLIFSTAKGMGTALQKMLSGDFSAVKNAFNAAVTFDIGAEQELERLLRKAKSLAEEKEQASASDPSNDGASDPSENGGDSGSPPPGKQPGSSQSATSASDLGSSTAITGSFDPRAFMHQFAAELKPPEPHQALEKFNDQFKGMADPRLSLQKQMTEAVQELVDIEKNKEPLVYGAG